MTDRAPIVRDRALAADYRRRARDKWAIAEHARDQSVAARLRSEAQALESQAQALESGTRFLL